MFYKVDNLNTKPAANYVRDLPITENMHDNARDNINSRLHIWTGPDLFSPNCKKKNLDLSRFIFLSCKKNNSGPVQIFSSKL